MSKHKPHHLEMDDEFFAQLDFLRADYDNALQTNEQQEKDIGRLIAILIERGIPLPGDIMDKYIKRISESDNGRLEALPFD